MLLDPIYVVLDENTLCYHYDPSPGWMTMMHACSISVIRGSNHYPGDAVAYPGGDPSRIRPAAPEDFATFRTQPPPNFQETPVTTTTYTIHRYSDSISIGVVKLTDEQFSHYKSMSQQPEGLIRLGSLPHDYYDLEADYQDTHEDTVVWLE